jgi:hypothetical protein
MNETRKPFWVKCTSCSHCWSPAYIPMDVSAFVKATRRPVCPMCGASGKGIVLAAQIDGVLLEGRPAPDATGGAE